MIIIHIDEEKRLHTCCFTGHRPEKLNLEESRVKSLLKMEITQALSDGFTIFITGMSRGIDIWAAQLVLKEREKNPQIKLICAVPFAGFEKNWNYKWQMEYNEIVSKADDVCYVCEKYFKGAFFVRNKFMVDRSNLVISAFNGAKGGTGYTINYALSNNVKVRNIFDINF